jgi:RHS repeat-associated protein
VHGTLGSIAIARDAAGRPTSATRNLPAATPPTSAASFAYDFASQVAGYGYDAMGRRTSGAGRSYGWDLASRLTSVVEGATTTTLGWDAFGRITSLDRGTTNRDYVWNYALPFPAISIESEDGAPLRHYVHHPSGRLLYAVDAATNARHFFHFDERGNTVFVTNGAGAVEASWAYGPYGEVSASSPGFDNPFTFVGEWGGLQLASGLFQMGRRSYDVTTAAFLSRDPVHPHLHPLSFNPYQYAGRDPMTRFDPTGADPTDAAAANQDSVAQTVLSTASSAISSTGQVSEMSDTVQVLANASEDATKAASRALGAHLILGHALNEAVTAGLGGPGARIVNKVIDAGDRYGKDFDRLDARADKLAGASRTLKAVEKVGGVLNAIEIGSEIYKLYDEIFEAHAFNDTIESGLYRTYVSQSTTAWDLYLRGKQSESWLRKQLIDIQYHLKSQLLWQGYLYSLENHINFWTAVGNIYGTFLPGFGFVGTENLANAAHQHVWNPVFSTLGNPWD